MAIEINYLNKLISFYYDDKGGSKIDFKINETDIFNLEDFYGIFSKNKLILPQELIDLIKLEKQFLILPDEIITFDYIVMPTFNVWKTKKSINLKLGIEYKAIENYEKNYKLIKKTKSNSIFSVQLVKKSLFKPFVEFFLNLGIKIKGINFYSDALGLFYSKNIFACKNPSIIVKITDKKTTIMALVNGFVICVENLNCGEMDIFNNIIYNFDEYSKNSISQKFVWFAKNQIDNGKNDEITTRSQIEKAFSKNKSTTTSKSVQSKKISIIDIIHKKIDDIKAFLSSSEFHLNIENIFIDVKSEEIFAKLKIPDAIKIYYPETEVFNSIKNNKMFIINSFLSKFTNKPILGGLWKRPRE